MTKIPHNQLENRILKSSTKVSDVCSRVANYKTKLFYAAKLCDAVISQKLQKSVLLRSGSLKFSHVFFKHLKSFHVLYIQQQKKEEIFVLM